MDTWTIVLIVLSLAFFGIVLATKSAKTTYHPKIRGPRGRLPGRDPAPPKGSSPSGKTPPKG
jgi:hypothetical protein